jgi:hypothetical protein
MTVATEPGPRYAKFFCNRRTRINKKTYSEFRIPPTQFFSRSSTSGKLETKHPVPNLDDATFF